MQEEAWENYYLIYGLRHGGLKWEWQRGEGRISDIDGIIASLLHSSVWCVYDCMRQCCRYLEGKPEGTDPAADCGHNKGRGEQSTLQGGGKATRNREENREHDSIALHHYITGQNSRMTKYRLQED